MDSRAPVVESAIVWFRGYEPESEWFEPASRAGGFVVGDGFDGRLVLDELRCWPAAVELTPPTPAGERQQLTYLGRRVGIDVERRCFVVEIGTGDVDETPARVLINIDAAAAVLDIGRNAVAGA